MNPNAACNEPSPLQDYVTSELIANKRLTVGVMSCIQSLAKVFEANQVSRALGPESFYNALISEKMDVLDHYSAWRQSQGSSTTATAAAAAAVAAAAPDAGAADTDADADASKRVQDAPFSFCSYAFLLDARAKSNVLHIEARFQVGL